MERGDGGAILSRRSFPRAAGDGQEYRACAECRLPGEKRPCEPILRRGDGGREVHHRPEAEEHYSEECCRYANPYLENEAEGRGDQGYTNEIGPEELARHPSWDEFHDRLSR